MLPAEEKPTPSMSNEEKKFLMKSIWRSLTKPDWTKDDLIEFGKAVFSKQTLKEMDDKMFSRIFPFLTIVTAELGISLSEQAELQIKKLEEEKKIEAEKTNSATGND